MRNQLLATLGAAGLLLGASLPAAAANTFNVQVTAPTVATITVTSPRQRHLRPRQYRHRHRPLHQHGQRHRRHPLEQGRHGLTDDRRRRRHDRRHGTATRSRSAPSR